MAHFKLPKPLKWLVRAVFLSMLAGIMFRTEEGTFVKPSDVRWEYIEQLESPCQRSILEKPCRLFTTEPLKCSGPWPSQGNSWRHQGLCLRTFSLSLSLSLFLPLSLPLLSSSPIPLIASLRNGDSVTANPKCCGFSSRRPCPLPPTRRSRVTTCPSWASPTPVNGKWHWTLTLYVLHFISSFTEDREHSFEHQQVWWPHK